MVRSVSSETFRGVSPSPAFLRQFTRDQERRLRYNGKIIPKLDGQEINFLDPEKQSLYRFESRLNGDELYFVLREEYRFADTYVDSLLPETVLSEVSDTAIQQSYEPSTETPSKQDRYELIEQSSDNEIDRDRVRSGIDPSDLKDLVYSMLTKQFEAKTSPRDAFGQAALLLRSAIHATVRDQMANHRAIMDAVVLAGEQVQDKRIDWLEAGPEVKIEHVIIEFILAAALGSNFLMGNLVKLCMGALFATARNTLNASRLVQVNLLRASLKRELTQTTRPLLNKARNDFNRAEEKTIYQIVKVTIDGAPPANLEKAWKEYHHTSNALDAIEEVAKAQIKEVRNSKTIKEKLKSADLEKWLAARDKASNAVLSRTGDIKKVVQDLKKKYQTKAKNATSPGVSILAAAQSYFRRQERFYEEVLAAADELATETSSGFGDAITNINALLFQYENIHHSHLDEETRGFLKLEAAIGFEHAIWILVLRSQYKWGSETIPQVNRDYGGPAYRYEISRTTPERTPDSRIFEYWKVRFASLYQPDELSDEASWVQAMEKRFASLQSQGVDTLFTAAVTFREESQET